MRALNPVMIVLSVLVGWAPDSVAGDQKTISLGPGEQRVFRVPGTAKLSVANPKVAQVKVSGKDQFILFGRQAGTTSLLIMRRAKKTLEWSIQVRDESVELFRASCAELLGPDGCVGLKVSRADGKLVLAGQVKDLETYHRVRKLKRAFPDLVLLVEVEPVVFDALVRAINAEFARAGLQSVKVSRIGNKIFLEGTVADELEKRKAETIVEAIYDTALGAP